jgi:hypothetical protein
MLVKTVLPITLSSLKERKQFKKLYIFLNIDGLATESLLLVSLLYLVIKDWTISNYIASTFAAVSGCG